MRQLFRQRFQRPIIRLLIATFFLLAFFPGRAAAQQEISPSSPSVPHVIQFNGQVAEPQGTGSAALTSGTTSITFTLYETEQGGTALWSETQNVQVDAQGKYTALLGSTSPEGLPLNLFTTGQAHWLQAQPVGAEFVEQQRVMLVGVPYAMKAADADTLGGLPASAFLQQTAAGAPTLGASGNAGASASSANRTPAKPPITGSGTADYVPLWTNSATLGNSVIYQSGTSVGINTTAPGAALGVKGKGIFTANTAYETLDATQSGGAGDGIHGNTQSATGYGVVGNVTATTGTTAGVKGTSASSKGRGVLGASNHVGVVGTSSGTSGTGSTYPYPAGVWGDTGAASDTAIGVYGSADDNAAGTFINISTSQATLAVENNTNTSATAPVFLTDNPVYDGKCTINVSGDLSCTGNFDNAVNVDGGVRKVALYSMQSPENWFEDIGTAELSGGSAIVTLDPTFSQTVNTGMDYHVFLTPDGDCRGLYVAGKTSTSFEVHELGGGRSGVAFDYRIVAKRKGFENQRLADVTRQMDVRLPHALGGDSSPRN